MKIVALVPARSGSKRVPDKNITPLYGKPLMEYTILAAQHSKYIEGVFVSTDSLSYAKLATNCGASFVPRPPELATDDTTDFPVVEHFLKQEKADYILYLRPTTPLRKVSIMDAVVKDFLNLQRDKNPPTSLRSVELMSESAFKCYTMLGQLLSSIGDPDQPNQKAPKTYKPNGYIDIIKPETMKAGDLWGKRVMGYVTPPTIEIDTPNDLKLAEYQIAIENGGCFVYTT